VYFKLVEWALKKLDSTLKWTPPEEAQMDQHTSSYVDAWNQIERGLLNKIFYFSYFPCQSCSKGNDKALDYWGLVPDGATYDSLHQFACSETEPHPTACLIDSENFLLTD
jgi:hypothetical protein